MSRASRYACAPRSLADHRSIGLMTGIAKQLSFALLARIFLAMIPTAAAQLAYAADLLGTETNYALPPVQQPDFLASWIAMVTATQAAQPHWITPLAVTTPRLEQEYRFDAFSTNQGNGTHINNYGGTRGLEFIPTYDTQVTIGMPGWIDERTARGRTIEGWGDMSVLFKYRFLSANEEQGNYIFTGFLQLAVPTGVNMISNDLYVLQPTLAFGKGWGNFDILATVSQQYPIASIGADNRLISNFGDPVLANVVLQYHLFEYFWPEVEFNYTYWPNGTHEGLSQLLMTTGIVIGRIPIAERVKFIIGAGYQTALTSNPVVNNNWILTARLTF
jgi:hypothetical protein